MTVAELDYRLDSAELTEWMAYENMTGPLGRRRGDIQAATIAATIANSNRGKGGRKFKLTDFLIPYGSEARKSPEQLLAAIKSLNKSMGGVERGRRDD
ncbi:tail assembly chaperone [Streptomyces phage Dryad]|nr:tail assembly chaperone [Streptomyces phage Dryad]